MFHILFPKTFSTNAPVQQKNSIFISQKYSTKRMTETSPQSSSNAMNIHSNLMDFWPNSRSRPYTFSQFSQIRKIFNLLVCCIEFYCFFIKIFQVLYSQTYFWCIRFCIKYMQCEPICILLKFINFHFSRSCNCKIYFFCLYLWKQKLKTQKNFTVIHNLKQSKSLLHYDFQFVAELRRVLPIHHENLRVGSSTMHI